MKTYITLGHNGEARLTLEKAGSVCMAYDVTDQHRAVELIHEKQSVIRIIGHPDDVIEYKCRAAGKGKA